jgi:hypothetical protein
MGPHPARRFTVGLMLAAVGLVSACSVPGVAVTPAANVPSAPVPVAQAPSAQDPSALVPLAPPVTVVAGGAPEAHYPAAKAPKAAPAPAPSGYDNGKKSYSGSDGDAVNCGKVGPKGGKQVDLLAVETKAGIVGCTEAFNVIAEYYEEAPTKSQGTAHVLDVQGWNCLADTGAYGSGAIGCDKNGFAFHTQP